jgi:hypothetical protein
MGRGGRGDFVASERAAAASFAQMARTQRIERVVYLGGLGDRPSPSTCAAATRRRLRWSHLRYLVQPLPAMIAPAWLNGRALGAAI